MRKDSRGNFIFDERETSIQDLIDLCDREFKTKFFHEMYFPTPNAELGKFEMIIEPLKREDASKYLNSDKTGYEIRFMPFLTLETVTQEIKRFPKYDLSKCYIGWLKGQFFLTINK